MANSKRPVGRPPKILILSDAERASLESIARRHKSAQRSALRARIVLMCAERKAAHEVASALRINRSTVEKWRERYRMLGLEGLLDEPRCGAPRTVLDTQVEDIVVRTLEQTPKGETHWSRASMAKAVGLSASTIGRVWRAFGLKPHVVETFKLSPDPQFIAKVRDIVGLYLSPPENAVVLCVDEKSQMQALERTQPLLPLRPGAVERRSHDYQRHGVTSLFAALDAHRGDVIHRHFRKHSHHEFIRFLDLIDENVPQELDVHLVLDNYGTHKTPRVRRWLARHPRFHVHFTPTYASWMNLVERLFGEVTNKAVRRGSHRSVRELEQAVTTYLEARETKPFIWTKTADEILASVRRFCVATSGGGH